MNPNDEHQKPTDEAADDQQFKKLLGGLDRDAADVDHAALESIRKRSADTFANERDQTPDSKPDDEEKPMYAAATQEPGSSVSPNGDLVRRRSGRAQWAWRAVAAAVLVALAWSVHLAFQSPGSQQALAFADVLQNTARADSLHLVVHRSDVRSEIWTQGQRLRWNVDERRYRVGNANRMWEVDQQTNRVQTQNSPYYHSDWKGIDVVAVLELGDRSQQAKKLLNEAQAERTKKDGVEYHVYRASLPAQKGEQAPLRIEALVDMSTGVLHSLEAVAMRGGKHQVLGQVVVVAMNEPMDEDMFVVGDTLSKDQRVGKVTDLQGIVSLQPVMHRRWTPVQPSMLLQTGDWVRTDPRGANAVTLRLLLQGDVTIGPGSQVEIVGPAELRVTRGELEVAAAKGQTIQLLGPDDQRIDVTGTAIYRTAQKTGQLAKVKKKPVWLEGYQGTVAHDSIGSLVANIDGRDVPLTVGDHKVSVDIRDQIARTSIEESFVNHTASRLEGVFYFPLPQDASISGFGMWIGGELIEADVVEKQRAREIYETILRERRDPALLEWSGGNLFKARVFPIEARSEKRIKITYTQVLPVERNLYRYNYALRSELLQQNPLRDLTIDVKVSSLLPIKKIHSPTHTTRTDATDNAGHVEFAAQEYTPDRDFEVVVELEGRQSDVVVVPHRRGDDGYFMLQLTPPATGNSRQRDVIPEGDPLRLLVLADTSASMDSAARELQAQLLASLCASLSPEDTMNVATCDVDCQWLFKKPQPVDELLTDNALDFVANRASLGWSDLDAAFDSVLRQSDANTHVLYIGDGIVTTQTADPVAFAQRLRQAYQKRGQGGAFHAISVSSTYEPIAMKAVASLGGGSFRQVSGERTPQLVVKELLDEIAQPAIRDLKVEFRDVRVAAVYPEQLPNLVAGTQQIVLGRFLPEGTDQRGDVVVTGVQNGKPVEFRSDISLKDAEQGNSFIPRLWARMHLDQLLQQGDSQSIRDEIIALSEEFHIMTPYTSLLVLESDEDRERFKVKRRFLMRDGERFFAQGRDQADYELVQKQMRRAGGWRIGLRRMVLSQLSNLGRDLSALQQLANSGFSIDQLLPTSRGAGLTLSGQLSAVGGLVPSRSFASHGGYAGERSSERFRSHESADELGFVDFDGNGISDVKDISNVTKQNEGDDLGLDVGGDAFGAPDSPLPSEESAAYPATEGDEDSELLDNSDSMMGDRELKKGFERDFAQKKESGRGEARFNRGPLVGGNLSALYDYRRAISTLSESNQRIREDSYQYGYYVNWLEQLFPRLPGVPAEVPPKTKQWPEEAVQLAASLLRTEKLRAIDGGIEISRRTESFDVRRNALSGVRQARELFSIDRWLIRTAADGGQTTVQWCDAQQRGTFNLAHQLGSVRKSAPRDMEVPPLGLGDYSLTPLYQSYPTYKVTIERPEPNRALMILKYPDHRDYEMRFEIDTQRNVVLSRVTTSAGKVSSTSTYKDFVQVAGTWWARQVETSDADGRINSQTKQTIAALNANALRQRFDTQLTDLDKVVLISDPAPSVAVAKSASAGGDATMDDRIVLMQHFSATQQWDRVWTHLEAAEKLAEQKPGIRWVRFALQKHSRRNQQLQESLLAEANALSKLADQLATGDPYFLANYIFGQASGVFQANEMLNLLDVLRPVYFGQLDHVAGKLFWHTNHATYLESAGRSDEGLEVRRQTALDYPFDYNSQTVYAQRLADAGNYDAAYTHLRAAIDRDFPWLPYEQDTLRSTYVNMLVPQGRYADVVEFCADWLEDGPADSTPYRQYLSALILSGQEEKAHPLIEAWLQAARESEKLSATDAGRFQAAVYQAVGQGYNMYTNYLDPRWLDPLADTVQNYGGDPAHFYMLAQIMNNHWFQRTDQCRQVRTKIAERLLNDIEQLTAVQIQNYVTWIFPNDPAVEKPTWKRIASAIQQRWSTEENEAYRTQLAQTLTQILPTKLDADAWLAFLRTQLAEGPDRQRSQYALQLFNAVIEQPWTQKLEDEAFSLLDQLPDPNQPDRQLAVQVDALHRLVNQLVAARYAATMDKLLVNDHPEELTRTELRTHRQDALRTAREGLAERLQQEQSRREGDPNPNPTPERGTPHHSDLAEWFHIERLYLDVQLGRDLNKVIGECWEHLGAKPKPPAQVQDFNGALDEILYGRYFVMVTNLSVRRTADDAQRQRLLDFVDKGVANGDTFWKLAKFHLLVALDQPKPLEAALRQWIALVVPPLGGPEPKHPPKKPLDVLSQQEQELENSLMANYWRVALAYLLAERGEIADGIQLLEAVEADDELMPPDYRTLADWYLVVDRRADRDRAMIAMYKTMDENRLQNYLSQKLNPWQRADGDLPTELDKDVLLVFRALFEKSTYPQNYLWQLRGFYTASRDFRLLSVLADGMVGQTPVKVYPFLNNINSVLQEIRDEATADSVVQHLATVRQRAKTPIDRRALDLLEMQVERRAAEVLNQPGPHVESALAAMRRAFDRAWSDGEPRLMAELLAALGNISQKELAAEQLTELQQLHRDAPHGSLDRLHIAHYWAQVMWYNSQYPQSIGQLKAALSEYQQANDGPLPAHANTIVATYASYLRSRDHFAQAESYLLGQLERDNIPQQTYWFTQQLYDVYHDALNDKGAVSIGRFPGLFGVLTEKIADDLTTRDNNHRYQLFHRICQVYRTAHGHKINGVAANLRKFAFDTAPGHLANQTDNYSNVVSEIGSTVHDVAGPRDGLAFLIERIEAEPAWLRYKHQDGWSQHAWSLAQWRDEVGRLGELEPRLLAIVLDALRRDLRHQQQRNRAMYANHNSHFWTAQQHEFARVAEDVYEERKNSGAAVLYIAEYLYHGLDLHDRAIEIMWDANKQRRLDETGQSRLVYFLHDQQRFVESIDLLRGMVELRPDTIVYRAQLMHALYRTQREAELLQVLTQTDKHFHDEGRWTEGNMAQLAASCLQNQLFTQSAAYYEELIPLHQRTHARRGIGNGTLSTYYTQQANAYAGLQQTPAAVEAACGAIISWGHRHENRTNAIQSLKQVLRDSPDLPAYLAHLDRETEESGLDKPIIRKALGLVFMDQRQFDAAITQLNLALAVQPNDAETHRALIDSYEKQGDRQGVIHQILAAVQLRRRDIELYRDLARKLNDDPKRSERALTSIVEVLPNETESHTMLAEIRQNQNRWDDAIGHWQRVSELRALEPTGLLKLAEAQIHEGHWSAARESLESLTTKTWPDRFGNVHSEARKLWEKVDRPGRSR